jgi:hypothetical protein
MRERTRREIDRRDFPSVRGKPQRLRSMTATRVERTPRTKAGDLGDQVRIRRTLRDLFGCSRSVFAQSCSQYARS